MAGLLDWASRFEAMSRGSFMDGLKRQVAVDGLALTAKCFATTTDPYGVPWTGLAHPRKGGPVLDKTGAMKNGALAGPIFGGVRFYFAATYSRFHQYGTEGRERNKNADKQTDLEREAHRRTQTGKGHLPIRRVLPVTFLGLPPSWSAMIQKAFNQHIKLAATH